ncbi:MAG: hypothetical protein ACFNO7_02765 [Bacteroides sp.]
MTNCTLFSGASVVTMGVKSVLRGAIKAPKIQSNEAIAQIVVTLQFSFWALFLHLDEQISL